MLTDIKYLKYIKLLCWSNKVKQGTSWECRIYDDEICVFTFRCANTTIKEPSGHNACIKLPEQPNKELTRFENHP